jgi:hypothetical protein
LRFDRPSNLDGRGQIGRERFLHKERQAMPGSGHFRRSMSKRRADIQRVQALAIEHLAIIGIGCAARTPGRCLGALDQRVGERGDLYIANASKLLR